jgi:hypothetical protein
MEVKAVDAARVEAIARSIGGDIMVEMMDGVDELRKWNVVRSWRLLRNNMVHCEEQSLLRLLRFLVDTLYGRADVMLNSARNAP